MHTWNYPERNYLGILTQLLSSTEEKDFMTLYKNLLVILNWWNSKFVGLIITYNTFHYQRYKWIIETCKSRKMVNENTAITNASIFGVWVWVFTLWLFVVHLWRYTHWTDVSRYAYRVTRREMESSFVLPRCVFAAICLIQVKACRCMFLWSVYRYNIENIKEWKNSLAALCRLLLNNYSSFLSNIN